MASRDIRDAHPALQELWAWLKPEAMRRYGIDIFLVATRRSNAEQTALYAQGRQSLREINRLRAIAGLGPVDPRDAGQRVTNVRAGQSAHNATPPGFSSAIDFGVLRGGRYEQSDLSLYLPVARLARDKGAESGAFWGGNFQDYPHIQLPDWRVGKTYPATFRLSGFQRARSAPVAPAPVSRPTPIPALPPRPAQKPPVALARVIVLENQARDGWERMAGAEADYGEHRITRLPGGNVTIHKLPGASAGAGLKLEYRDGGQLWIARTGGTA